LGPHYRLFTSGSFRSIAWNYAGLRREGSNPVPLPPPAWPKVCILRVNLWQLSPIAAAISHLSSGLLIGRARSLFSDRPISLQSSGLRRFGTVLEIRMFRETYEFQRKEVLLLLLDRREHPISNSPYRGSNPLAPGRQSGAPRTCPPKAQKGPPMAGFCWVTNLGFLRGKWPKVSGRHLENSRFWEISIGDRVGPALCGRVYTAICQRRLVTAGDLGQTYSAEQPALSY
jgi:hypothetical protein